MKMLTLSEIYQWFLENSASYGEKCDVNDKGWRNSVRHNLSLQRRFRRIPPVKPNRSSYWEVVDVDKMEPKDFLDYYFRVHPDVVYATISNLHEQNQRKMSFGQHPFFNFPNQSLYYS